MADDGSWKAGGHDRPWDGYAAQRVREFGIRFFCRESFRGPVFLGDVRLLPGPEERSPISGIHDFRVNSPVVRQYEKFEARFRIPRVYTNPFDPEEVDVRATFVSPSGKTSEVAGFYHQEFRRSIRANRERLDPVGPGEWMVRFSPAETGVYTYALRVRDRQGTYASARRRFRATASNRPGFVRVSSVNPRYFEFTGGAFYYPIGHSVISPVDERYGRWHAMPPDHGTHNYDRFFSRMGQAGENWTRVWMSSWWLGLEWKDGWPGYHGLGRYNTENAWRLDRLMDLAEENGIYVTLVLHSHGQFVEGSWVTNEWQSNPYNKANGGMSETPADFFRGERERMLLKQRLRYIVARWGYSPNILSWELCNEVYAVRVDKEVLRDWHAEMAGYLRQEDLGRHMVTTSAGAEKIALDYLWALPEMEYV